MGPSGVRVEWMEESVGGMCRVKEGVRVKDEGPESREGQKGRRGRTEDTSQLLQATGV